MTPPGNVAVNAPITHEDPVLLRDFFAFAAANPLRRYTITSGDRTSQPASGVGGNVAPEGASYHELYAYGKAPFDEAIDVTVDGRYLGSDETAAQLHGYGLQLPVKTDLVHVTRTGWNG